MKIKPSSEIARVRARLKGLRRSSIAIALLVGMASPARAQSPGFTEIYNSGLLTLGSDETLKVTIVNNNNVDDPAVPALTASAEACTFVAQLLDANASPLQKQQQTLQPGQNFSFSINGPQTVQARVDISPGTSSGFADLIAGQCVVSDEILNTASNDAVRVPPLSTSQVKEGELHCISGCGLDCSFRCRATKPHNPCIKACVEACGGRCF